MRRFPYRFHTSARFMTVRPPELEFSSGMVESLQQGYAVFLVL